MLGTNWRTNLGAIGVALGTVATIISSVANGSFVLNTETISALVTAVSAVWGLFAAKDKQVTGGSIVQYPTPPRQDG